MADSRSTLAPGPLDLHIEESAFGQVATEDIRDVLRATGDEIWRFCPGTYLDGIDIYRRSDHSQTDFKRSANGRIAVGLTAQDTYWAQYSFQFAHEFCHVLAVYGDNPGRMRSPSQANLWLEESLCETASLFTLRAMSRSWQTRPPHSRWKSYAPWFRSYADERLASSNHHLRNGTSFSDWFRQNQGALRRSSVMFDRNTIIATQCLPVFEGEPRGWKALVYFNGDVSDPNETLAQHFAKWHKRCPHELRPFVRKLAEIFAVNLKQ